MAVRWFGDTVFERIKQAAMIGVVRGTEEVKGEALRLIMQTTKTGRVYRRRGVEHQASAPGEPPASDTGTLVGNTRTEYDHLDLRGTVKFSTDYAAYLEYGTQFMEPRPFARPALTNTEDRIEEMITEEIESTLRNSGFTRR